MMDLKFFINIIFITITSASNSDIKNDTVDNVFNGVYTECFLHLSYSCLQKKTLLYLKELNNLNEVSVIGEYVKFVKINKSDHEDTANDTKTAETEELAFMIDQAIDHFFDNHVLKFYALGRNISMPRNVEEFVGRKKRKGGGGGGGGHGGGGGGHDDGGKKKMMMMAMMCMKMKLMMMVPAMMGMMGMMSFKGMMFSMMSFMLSKMMLLMKILEKKGGAGGIGGGGGADGGWAAGGAGGGAWMPAGGQDYGGGGGGYDANGQWQSRSIVDNLRSYKTIDDSDIIRPVDQSWEANKRTYDWLKGEEYKPMMIVTPADKSEWKDDSYVKSDENKPPEISFVKRAIRYNNKLERDEDSKKHPVLVYKRSNVHFDFNDPENNIEQSYGNRDKSESRSKRDLRKVGLKFFKNQQTDKKVQINKGVTDNKRNPGHNIKSRQKRSIIDILQNSYIYWMNQILGLNNNRRTNPPRYKIVNGIKYVYYPYKMLKPKMPRELPVNLNEDIKPLMAIEEFNKGEIVEGIESRMNKKKFNKMKDSVNDTMEDNPWE